MLAVAVLQSIPTLAKQIFLLFLPLFDMHLRLKKNLYKIILIFFYLLLLTFLISTI